MKKFLLIIFFSLIFSNFSFSKSINLGLHNLDVQNKFVEFEKAKKKILN